jgi:CBS domain-containing protein
MKTIRHVLDQKGREVHSIHPDATVFAALKKMAEKNVGSMAVVEDGELAGIFTERLYAREIALMGRSSSNTRLRDVVSAVLEFARPEQTVEECMAVMTNKTVRHLPVFDNGELVGIISIGDMVKSVIGDQKFIIEQLEHYIHGEHH